MDSSQDDEGLLAADYNVGRYKTIRIPFCAATIDSGSYTTPLCATEAAL